MTKTLTPNYTFEGSEKQLEDYIDENISDIAINCLWGPVERSERQYVIRSGHKRTIVDIMVFHKDGTGTAIEIKTGKTNRSDILMAIGQSLFYGVKMQERLRSEARLVIASPCIDPDIYKIVKKYSLPIHLLMVDGERCIYL